MKPQYICSRRQYRLLAKSSAVGLTKMFPVKEKAGFADCFSTRSTGFEKNVLKVDMGVGVKHTQITFILRWLLILFL